MSFYLVIRRLRLNTKIKPHFRYIFQEYFLRLNAVVAIKKGEEIFTRYTPPQLTTIRRQHLLQSQWHFSCECRRCQDPTECGTMGNAIKCHFEHDDNDDKNYMLPQNPTDLDSDWRCIANPLHTVSAEYAMKIICEVEGCIKSAERVSTLF